MNIRLISVKEDFEAAYGILNQREYPLSFYEYTLKHDLIHNAKKLKLLGVFNNEECLGTISYLLSICPDLGRILEIKEIHNKNIIGYKTMMNFIDEIAYDEECHAIKICKNLPERLSNSVFDKIENFLKGLLN